MGLFNILKGKLKATNENKVVEDDTKLYTDVIYNSFDNLIILISYSSNYSAQMVEFLDAVSAAGLGFATLQSSYESDMEEEKKENDSIAFRPEKIKHQRYYIVLFGCVLNYAEVYNRIESLSNDILLAVQDEIYQHCSSTFFNQHIDNGVLTIHNFVNKQVAPQYDTDRRVYIGIDSYLMNDPKTIMSKLPSGFLEKDILRMIKIVNYIGNHTSKSLLRLVKDEHKKKETYDLFISEYANEILKDIIGEVTKEKIDRLISLPKYLLQDDDIFIGDINDERLDDIFRQRYEKFSGIAGESEYVDNGIDEVITDDDGGNEDGSE